jgi:hypothetical protein
MAVKKRKRKPDNIQNFITDDDFYKISSLILQTLNIIFQENGQQTQHLFNKINEERKFEETKNYTI